MIFTAASWLHHDDKPQSIDQPTSLSTFEFMFLFNFFKIYLSTFRMKEREVKPFHSFEASWFLMFQ